MSEGEVGVVEFEALLGLYHAKLVLLLLGDFFVDVGLAYVVEQRGDYHAVFGEVFSHIFVHGYHLLAYAECYAAHVERVLHESAVIIEVK